MDNLIKHLKRIFFFATLPTLAFFALFYLAADEKLVTDRMHYTLMVLMFLLLFVWFVSLIIVKKRSEKKCEGKSFDEQVRITLRTYKVRIISLNVMIFVSSLLYLILVDLNCIYVAGMLALYVVMNYPTEYLLSNNIDTKNCKSE